MMQISLIKSLIL